MMFSLLTEAVRVNSLASSVQFNVVVALPLASIDAIETIGISLLMPMVWVA